MCCSLLTSDGLRRKKVLTSQLPEFDAELLHFDKMILSMMNQMTNHNLHKLHIIIHVLVRFCNLYFITRPNSKS